MKFISYDGKWPNLCRGTLVVEHEGKEWAFESSSLSSGGCIQRDAKGIMWAEQGPWTIDEWPKDFPEELKEETVNLVNDNVPHGCCGGCI